MTTTTTPATGSDYLPHRQILVIVGGLMTAGARRWLPSGSVKEFLTTAVTPSLGHIDIDLVIIKFGLGPIALDVSLLSLVGVLIAYLIARSLF